MITFRIKDGALFRGDFLLARGYAGNGACKNDPASQAVKNHGPLPVGAYRIGDPVDHPHLGPHALPLEPLPGTEMHGRGGFYIHGDSISNPGEGSDGCICAPRAPRQTISENDERLLVVVSGNF